MKMMNNNDNDNDIDDDDNDISEASRCDTIIDARFWAQLASPVRISVDKAKSGKLPNDYYFKG